MSGTKGVDIGTNLLVVASVDGDGKSVFKMERDGFYKIIPKSQIHKNSIRNALEVREFNFIEDVDGSFIVIGEAACEMAIERNDVTKRPLKKGVISPKEKDSFPILKLLIESLVGRGDGDNLVYSVPAKSIDDSSFDIVYHTSLLEKFFNDMGYKAKPINEGFAVAYSEMVKDGLCGIATSWGAGMVNVCVVYHGDLIVEFSTTKAGDYIDLSTAQALDLSPSFIQLEKEHGIDLFNPSTKIMEAVSIYYNSVIRYNVENIVFELQRLKEKKILPDFIDGVPFVVSGGLTLANGFVERVQEIINTVKFPVKIKEVRRAESPMTSVAKGCLLAAQLSV